MAPHSSTLAWKIPWMEEPGGPQSMGSLRVRQDSETSLSLFTCLHWRRQWQPTPVFLPGESQGRGSLVGCRLWSRTESDTTEATQQQQQQAPQRFGKIKMSASRKFCIRNCNAAAAAKSLHSQPTRVLRPWDFPGKSTGVGCHCLLREIAIGISNLECFAKDSTNSSDCRVHTSVLLI